MKRLLNRYTGTILLLDVITEPGVVADRSRLQEGYRSMGGGVGWFQGARKRAGS